MWGHNRRSYAASQTGVIMNELDSFLHAVTPDVYRRFRRAIELKKWPDGTPLKPQQLEICMQAVIAYEIKHLPESERTGFMPPKEEPCKVDDSEVEAVRWRTEEGN